jgi:hypothetical protein
MNQMHPVTTFTWVIKENNGMMLVHQTGTSDLTIEMPVPKETTYSSSIALRLLRKHDVILPMKQYQQLNSLSRTKARARAGLSTVTLVGMRLKLTIVLLAVRMQDSQSLPTAPIES